MVGSEHTRNPLTMTPQTTVGVQTTLSGEQTDHERERPDTFQWCEETEEWVLRSRRFELEYPLYDDPDSVPSDDGNSTTTSLEDDDEDDDEPREVGGVFSVSLSYDVTYRKEITAANEKQAIELAKDELSHRDDCPVDAIQLHDDATKQETLTEDDERCEEMPGWPW